MLRAVAFYGLVLIGIPISFFAPFSGLLLYLFFAHGHPADFVWPGYLFNYGLVLVPVLLAGYTIFEARKSPPRIRGMVLLLLFWGWLTASSLLAESSQVSIDKLMQFSKMFIIAFLIAAMATSEERVSRILRVIAFSLGLLGLKSLLDIVLTGGQYRMRGPGGMMSEENEYALGMNMAIPLLYWMASIEHGRWMRWFFRAGAIACAATVVFTRSRSGFLGLLIVCLLIGLRSRRKLLVPIGFAVLSILFLAFAPSAAINRYKTIPTATEDDPSAIGRIQMWETAVKMMEAHPVFGVGLKNFEASVPRYTSYEPRAPHNAFIALLAESGIPSCLLFLALVFGASGSCWLNWKRLRHDPGSQELATYCLIVHTMLLVYLVPNFFINRQDFDLMYHLVGLSAGISMVARQRIFQAAAEASAAPEVEPGWAIQPDEVPA